MGLSILFLIFLYLCHYAQPCFAYQFAPNSTSTTPPRITHRPNSRMVTLGRRQDITTEMSTCGYKDGDPKKSRTAEPGYNCRVDTRNGLWGFCPTTIAVATDCGLAGSCVDEDLCSEGCGKTDETDLTTFTCSGKSYCSTVLLAFGVDQTYAYLACGATAVVENLLASPTSEKETKAPKVTTTSDDIGFEDFTSTQLRVTTSPRVTTSAEPGSSDNPQSSDDPTTTVESESKDATESSDKPQSSGPAEELPAIETPDESSDTTPAQAPNTASSKSSSSAPTSSASTASGTSSQGNSIPIGPVVGGVLGGIAIICATVIGTVYLRRRYSGSSRSSADAATTEGIDVCRSQGMYAKPQHHSFIKADNSGLYELPSNYGPQHGRIAELGG